MTFKPLVAPVLVCLAPGVSLPALAVEGLAEVRIGTGVAQLEVQGEGREPLPKPPRAATSGGRLRKEGPAGRGGSSFKGADGHALGRAAFTLEVE